MEIGVLESNFDRFVYRCAS